LVRISIFYCFLVLSYTGRFLKPDELLSSHNIRENDILRILQSDGDSKANKACDNAMLRECDRLFDYVQKEESGYMHLRLIADVTMPDYLKTFTDMFPELRKDPIACHILGDYYILKAMVTLPSDEESLEKLRKFHAQHPALLPAINWLLKKNAQKGRESSFPFPCSGWFISSFWTFCSF
ncbi:hypothetical protein OESDEN_05487, partial [Oesophagostomum dentatum]